MSEEVHDLNTPSDADKRSAELARIRAEVETLQQAAMAYGHERQNMLAQIETLKHNHEIECGALADEVHALKARNVSLETRNAELEWSRRMDDRDYAADEPQVKAADELTAESQKLGFYK